MALAAVIPLAVSAMMSFDVVNTVYSLKIIMLISARASKISVIRRNVGNDVIILKTHCVRTAI